MSDSTNVEVRLSANDTASAGIKKVEKEAQKGAEKTATATEKAAAKAAAATERGARMQRNSFQKMANAREALGIRSEKTIQREIERTQASYNRLARSGTMSWREQARAAEQMKQRVTQLTNEMGKLTGKQKALAGLKLGAAVAGGAAAAAYTLKDPAARAMDYDLQMAHMSRAIFSGRDKQGKEEGRKELEAAINNAVKSGGGTRDEAAGAMKELVTSGKMNFEEAAKMLPELTKAATANDVDINELTRFVVASMRTSNVKAEEIPNLLNQIAAGAEAGGFSLSGLMQFLPRQLAAGAQSGLSGREDVAALVALNQAALNTSGDQEEAGRAVQTTLELMNNPAIAEHLKKTTGVNLSKHLQSESAKGVNSIDAFTGLLQKSLAKDKGYQAAQAKLAAAKTDDERNEALEGMNAIAQRSGLGNLVNNKRAMMAILAAMNEQGFMQEVRQKMQANDVATGGINDSNLEYILGQSASQVKMRQEVSEMGKKEAMDSLTPTIGKLNEWFSDLASKNSLLVGATTLATTALTAFAGVAGAAVFAMGGGKGLVSGAKGAAGMVANGAKGAAGMVTGGAGRIVAAKAAGSLLPSLAAAGVGTSALALTAAGAGGYAVGSGINWAANKSASMLAGREVSLGTLFAESSLGKWLSGVDIDEEAIAKSMAAIKPPEPPPVEMDAKIQLSLDPGLLVKGQTMHATGGNVRMDTGNVHTGAPH